MYAYCFASGRIGFRARTPKGALPIARGPDSRRGRRRLREFLCGVSRHSYDGKTLIVPGIPEASSQFAAHRALEAFISWIATHSESGDIVVLTRANRQRQFRRGRPRRHG
jgi:hypothetical protein